jgi:HNH endonuclease
MSGRLPSDVMPQEPLPEPEGEQLATLLGEGSTRLAYGLLYRRRSHPPTAAEIGFYLDTAASGSTSTDRVLRSLRSHFDIAAVADRRGDERYELRGWATHHQAEESPSLSRRRRAQALAPGLCAQCGKTPLKHGVVLEVDLKVPPEWGGTTDPENLQPLCEECLEGKRQYQETYVSYSEQIRHAASFDEPQRRIGELLLALRDEWVPSELIGIVASAKEYQTDYEKRTRELRLLGWDYKVRKAHGEGARTRVYYRLTQSEPWPENIHAAIVAEERRRRAAKGKKSAGSDGTQ